MPLPEHGAVLAPLLGQVHIGQLGQPDTACIREPFSVDDTVAGARLLNFVVAANPFGRVVDHAGRTMFRST